MIYTDLQGYQVVKALEMVFRPYEKCQFCPHPFRRAHEDLLTESGLLLQVVHPLIHDVDGRVPNCGSVACREAGDDNSAMASPFGAFEREDARAKQACDGSIRDFVFDKVLVIAVNLVDSLARGNSLFSLCEIRMTNDSELTRASATRTVTTGGNREGTTRTLELNLRYRSFLSFQARGSCKLKRQW